MHSGTWGRRLALLAWTVTLLPLEAAWAGDESESSWIVDDATGCAVHNPNPKEDENISWTGECEDGKASGPGTLSWFLGGERNGTIAGVMNDGRWEGEVDKIYVNGHTATGTYVNGVLHGIWTVRDGEGTLRSETPWVSGTRQGIGRRYTEEGLLRTECEYSEGTLNGNCSRYTADGTVDKITPYRNGSKHGTETIYWTSKLENDYVDGELVEMRAYHDNGQLKEQRHFEGGRLHGDWVRYDEGGVLEHRTTYRHGEAGEAYQRPTTPPASPPQSGDSDSGPFRASTVRGLGDPEVVIHNNSDRTITVSLSGPGSYSLTVGPNDKTTRQVESGSYRYSAQARGVRGLSGEKFFATDNRYTWVFDVVTRLR